MTMHSIRTDILKYSTVGVFVIVVIVLILIDMILSTQMDHEFDERLENKASLLITITKSLDDGIDFDFADEFMPEFLSIKGEGIAENAGVEYMPAHLENDTTQEFFEVRFADGDILETSYSLVDNHLPIIETDEDTVFRTLHFENQQKVRMVQVKFKPQIPEDERRTPEIIAAVPDMIMSVAIPTQEHDSLKWMIHSSFFLLSFITLFFIYNIVSRSLQKGLLPLKKLENEIFNLNIGNLNQRVRSGEAVLEINSVVEQINQLLQRLDSSVQREKRFSSNVSHELRTPVSEIKALADVALKWPNDQGLLVRSLEDIRDASTQMEGLIKKLLELAKFENQDINPVYGAIDIETCVNSIEANLKNCLDERGLILEQRYHGAKHCVASKEHLDILLKNLLHNAAKYAISDSSIHFVVSTVAGKTKIEIRNRVDNLTKADTKSMFERFWMKDDVRTDLQNTGIGLSLCKALCDALNYHIYAELVELRDETWLHVSLCNIKSS